LPKAPFPIISPLIQAKCATDLEDSVEDELVELWLLEVKYVEAVFVERFLCGTYFIVFIQELVSDAVP
jgi:hypothetical protein